MNMDNRKFLWLSGGLFFLLTLIFTLPVWRDPARLLLCDYISRGGLPENDQNEFLFGLWWVGEALFREHVNPWFCGHLGRPEGLSLIYTMMCPLLGVLGYPLIAVAGAVAGLNFWYFVSFFLLPVLTVALVLELGGKREGALLAGFLVFFSFFQQNQISHLNVLSGYWFPLCYLLYLRFLRKKSWRSALGFGLGLGGVFYVCPYQTIHVFLLLGADAVWRAAGFAWRREKSNYQFLGKMAAAAGMFLILAAPFFISKALDRRHDAVEVAMILPAKVFWSAEIKDFFIFRGGEFAVFPGYLWWAALALIVGLRRGGFDNKKLFIFSMGFVLLSMGPILKWNGPLKVDFTESGYIFLPASLMHGLPLLEGYRVFVRMGFCAVFLMSVWVGCNLDFSRWRLAVAGWRGGAFVMILLAAAVLVERMHFFQDGFFPLKTFEVKMPSFYRELRASGADETLYEFPAEKRTYLLPLTVHKKQLINYFTSRRIVTQEEKISSNAFLSLMRSFESAGKEAPFAQSGLASEATRRDFEKLAITAVVLHPPLLTPPQATTAREVFMNTLGLKEVWKDNEIEVYRRQN